jgi:glutamate/tyrosine decarboxylase-like PLP-dependent enzyme
VLPFSGLCDHPRFFAYIPGSGTWPAALADLIASACNIDTSFWREATGLSQLELTVLDWFKEWIGYPAQASGVLVSGGSAANMTALACAREALLGPMSDRVVAYVSDQAHSSMARAARILGFRPQQVRVLPADRHLRMRPASLVAAMDADVRSGLQPLFVGAAAGSTNTGAVDPLPELAGICRERGVWFHVDAAYGGFAALTERGKRLLAGMELADSVTLDPHKWLYQPFECGCLLVREGSLLRAAFEIVPEYLKDAHVVSREVNFSNLGMQLTRMSRALKVWMSLRYFGADAFRAAIDRAMDLARLAQERIEASTELELVTPATLSVVTFRRRFDGVEGEDQVEWLNAEVIRRLAESGDGLVSSTHLRGRYAIRLCVLNHATTADDVHRVLELIEREAVSVEEVAAAAPAGPERKRDPGVQLAWLARPGLDAEALRALPLFGALTDEEADRVLAAAAERRVGAGEAVVQEWEYAREFYVILEGAVDVHSGPRRLVDLGPGEFFGELAAMEWGADFSYPRTASVTATSPLRLLVLPGAALNDLVRDVPSVAEQIRRAVRERVAEL